MADRVSQFPPIGLVFYYCFLTFFEDLREKKTYFKLYGGGVNGMLAEFVCR